MDAGDIVRIKDFQTYLGENVVNVYHYQALSNGILLSDVAQAFFIQVVQPLRDVQSQFCDHIAIECEVVSGAPDDFTLTLSPPTPGNVAGQYLPAFMSWGFKLNRATKLTRNGSKRITGLGEDQVENGAATAAAAAPLQAVADAMAANLQESLIDICKPVIVRILSDGSIPTVNDVSGVQYVRLTTQNSRKTY